MKLIDLLCMIDDNCNVVVVDIFSAELCRYDGRDAIDEMYNNYDIVSIYHQADGLYVSVDCFKY